MVWRRVAHRFVEQRAPGLVTISYRDATDVGSGELLLWKAADGEVVGFSLSYRPLGGDEHLADWHRGTPLRVGRVDSGESRAARAGRFRMSPTIRYARPPDPRALALLVAYFERSAAALAARERETIAAVLAGAHPDSPPR